MTQRIIATRSSSIIEKRKLIAAYLLEHPEGCTPKMIASGTSLNVNTVKSILPKLTNITTIARGLYKVVNRGYGEYSSTGDLKSWNFHNLRLSFPISNSSSLAPESSLDLDLVQIQISINNSGNASAIISTDYPLSVSSISLVHKCICLFLKEDIPMRKMQITSIEFNKDFPNIKMEGVNCITIDKLYEEFKLYQKKTGLRLEYKTKANFDPETLTDMLSGSMDSESSNKLNEAIKRLDKLTGQSVYNTALLNRLLEARTNGN
jgi:hypothetical protein